MLPQKVVDAPSLEVFKNRLDKFMDSNELSNKIWLLTQPMKSDDDNNDVKAFRKSVGLMLCQLPVCYLEQ